ncbi:tRNA (5-methylaminomethyl-2-thiouridine)(34)-methyltransferase MnmD [Persephonella sp. KM09-Lau-8]|uniref:tRNA (5-methylaminomethyl-2-thiouridine)(34)-methyltransferase MnmD n=1 Tax=Persephonella sp. KM09-Lau-8 TaxID=1158345 RepID=UPI00069239C9|nr:tRNA (5-methylaminomethyl-2-thiouridine)(34)-methyltransferase MnmD [Persephonella sp. KM09-Lau-8]
MDSKIKTADGTETFINQEFNEAYHSTKAGAYTESLLKFVLPCRIDQLAKKQNQIDILDIGFGLGYNVAVAIEVATKNNPNIFLKIISVEKDKDIFSKIKQLELPPNLQNIYSQILSGQFNGDTYTARENNFELTILFGEARQVIKTIDHKFDAVFYDAFSPKVNTEMWTVELFKKVKDLMKENAILATYSASLAVRKGLIEAGFKIGLIEPVGRKSFSTVATINGDIPPLTEKEENRLKTSPYAVPYHDNQDLTLSREEIKSNWEKEVQRRLSNKYTKTMTN